MEGSLGICYEAHGSADAATTYSNVFDDGCREFFCGRAMLRVRLLWLAAAALGARASELQSY